MRAYGVVNPKWNTITGPGIIWPIPGQPFGYSGLPRVVAIRIFRVVFILLHSDFDFRHTIEPQT